MTIRRAVCALALACGVMGWCGSVAARPDEPAKPAVIAITHVTVIDVERGMPSPDRTVVITGERITAVQDGSAPVPDGAKAIDGRGQFLIPGLIDSHVHYIEPE